MPSASKLPYSPSWSRFADNFQRDLKVWLVFMAALSVCRAAIIFIFCDRMDPDSGVGTALVAMANGTRFDAPVATAWLLPPFLASIASGFLDMPRIAATVRKVVAAIFFPVTFFLGIVTYGFFKEFNDQFNHFILNAIYDDIGAALATVWKEHPVIWASAGLVAGSVALYLGTTRLAEKLNVSRQRLERLTSVGKGPSLCGCRGLPH
ncbi:MAG: hypothetical protein N3A38_16330 [Planctomycetota bacterium]|nr:hypothetical protein [Planctomycetota bacterium]